MLDNKKIVVIMPANNAEKVLKMTFDLIPHDVVDEIILTDAWVPAKKAHDSARSRFTRDSTAIIKNRRVSTDLAGFQRGC